MKNRKSQIFSLDVIVAFFVLVMVLSSSVWLWNTSREKIHISEMRNDLELKARNAIYSLIQTVGDPPNWNILPVINETTVYSIGIGKNRPWFIDESKLSKLEQINDSNYDFIKKLLTVRNDEFFLNVSKYNNTLNKYETIALVGKRPTDNVQQVVRIERIALSGDLSWVKVIIFVWHKCTGDVC